MRWLCVFLQSIFLFLLPLQIWSADTWENPPEVLPNTISGSSGGSPQIVTDYLGNSHALYFAKSGTGPYTYVILYSYRPHGGSWQTPLNLSGTLNVSGLGALTDPIIAITQDLQPDGTGTVYAAWLYSNADGDNNNTLVATTIAAPYIAATTAQILDFSGFAQNFCLTYNDQIVSGVNQHGAIIVYEYLSSGFASGIFYATNNGTTWGASGSFVFDGTGATRYATPQVMTGADSQAFAFWLQGSASAFNAYTATYTYSGETISNGTWLTPVQVTSSNEAVLGVTPNMCNLSNRNPGANDQQAYVTWVEGTSGNYTILAALLFGSTPIPVTVASSLSTAYNVQIQANFSTESVVGIVSWGVGDSQFKIYETANVDLITAFSSQTFSTTNVRNCFLSYDQGSYGVVVWNDNGVIYGATEESGILSDWSTPEVVSNETASYSANECQVCAYGYHLSNLLEAVAIFRCIIGADTNIQSATLNYSAPPPPPSGEKERAFERPNTSRTRPSVS